MTDNIERIRSLFMAALMVVSVVAVTSAMAGTAAAGVASADRSVSDSSVSPGGDVTVTTTVNMDGDGGSLTISESFSPDVQSASIDSVEVDGSSASTVVETADSTGALVTLQDTPANSEVVVTYTVTTEDVQNEDYEITGTASGSGTEADIGSDTISTTDDDTEPEPDPVEGDAAALSSGSTFYTGQDVVVNGLDANAEYTVNPVDDNEVESLRQALSADADGTAEFELSSGLSDGEFVLVSDNGEVVRVEDGTAQETLDPTSESNVQSASFDVVAQDLTAEFDESDVGNDGGETTVEYEIESDVRNNYVVNISAQGDLDADELSDIFGGEADISTYEDDDETIRITQPGSSTAEGTYDLDFDEIDSGTYTFEANVTDADASDADDIEVTDTGDASADFSQSIYSDQRGDLVNISVEMSNTDVATLQVGDVDESGYSIVTEVEDENEDGVAYVEFNSFLAGSDTTDVLTAGDDETDISNTFIVEGSFDDNQPAGSDLLDSGDYNLYVVEGESDGSEVGSSDADNRATLDLNDASVDNIQTWTAPEEDLNDLRDEDVEDIPARAEAGNLTQTDSIAEGDAVVVQVEASGFEGALEAGDATTLYNATSENADIFSLSFEEESAPLNQEEGVVNISDIGADDYDVLYDGANDAHYVVIDSAALTDQFTHEDGDEYTANFTVFEDGTDLVDDSTSVTTDFNVDDPELELDGNEDDEIILEAGPGQELTGTTNLAPGSEVEVSLDSDTSTDPFLKRPTADVQADGSFTAVANFSDNNAGSNFTAQAVVGDVDSDEYDGQLVEFTGSTETPTEGNMTATPTEEPTEEPTEMPTEEPTEMPTEEPTEEETTTGGTGPGFTAAIALIALIAAALLAVRRDN